jgi:hypothetical protein
MEVGVFADGAFHWQLLGFEFRDSSKKLNGYQRSALKMVFVFDKSSKCRLAGKVGTEARPTKKFKEANRDILQPAVFLDYPEIRYSRKGGIWTEQVRQMSQKLEKGDRNRV